MENMRKQKKSFLIPFYILGPFVILLIIAFFYFLYPLPSTKVAEANQSYKEGESATTINARKIAFNHALKLYMNLEKRYQPQFGNGKLYFNIANTYFQLEEYPLAILYYYRALALSPYDKTISDNLLIALNHLEITYKEEKSAISKIFFFHYFFPLPIRFQIFFMVTIFGLISFSLWFWECSKKFKSAALFLGALSIVMFLSLLYTYLLENPSAIIVKSTGLYRGAGIEFAKVSDIPLKAGSKVTVLQVEKEGEWLKIEDEQNAIGFVQSHSIKVI